MELVSSPPSSSLTLNTIIGVEDAIKNMTPEEEVERYGTVDDFVATILKKWEAEYEFDINNYDGAPPVDLVWKGWDAAYIKSKGLHACQGATLESTGLNDAIGRVFLKRKDAPTLLEVFGNRKAGDFSLEGSPEVSVEKIPMKERKEFAVALLATQVMYFFWGWNKLERSKEIDGKAIRDRVFDCVVKFVLSIFDEEDFYRLCHQYKIKEEHMKFCYGHTDSLPSSEDLSPDKFPYLCEPDVYFALQEIGAYHDKAAKGDEELLEFHEVCFYNDDYLKPCFRVSDVARALELMQNHRRLKGHLQAQLILEISREKCFHVLDTLILEAINGMNLPKYDIMQDLVWKDDDGDEYPDFLLSMIDCVVCGLEHLSILKHIGLITVEKAIIDALDKEFGPFEDEVSEVIKRANNERRIGNCRFIGLAHLWVALSFSRVRDMLTDIACSYLFRELCLLDGTSELYTFRLFTLSRCLASSLGHEKIGLEHLVFSIVYGSSQDTLMNSIQHKGRKLFKSLAECYSDSRLVESWRNIDVLATVFEERCRIGITMVCPHSDLVNKLRESIALGRLVLPKYEDLRVM